MPPILLLLPMKLHVLLCGIWWVLLRCFEVWWNRLIRRSRPHIQSKWHETGSTYQRQLPQQTESMQQSGRRLLLIEWFHHTAKQRSSTQHIPHTKTCNVIGNRSRIGGIINYAPGACIHHNHLGRNGTQAAPHTTTNRKFDGRRGGQWQDTTKAEKCHGYALPLVERQRMPGAVQNILETRQIQLCRLLDKAPPFETPQEY